MKAEKEKKNMTVFPDGKREQMHRKENYVVITIVKSYLYLKLSWKKSKFGRINGDEKRVGVRRI